MSLEKYKEQICKYGLKLNYVLSFRQSIDKNKLNAHNGSDQKAS